MRITLPYGRTTVSADIDEARLLGLYESRLPPPAPSPGHAVADALDHPIGAPRLEDLAVGKRSAVIITSDHTRPVPSHVTLPPMLARLRRGQPGIRVTILVATGFHRATTRAELIEKLGADVVANETIVVHDSTDDSAMVPLGVLPSGGALLLNRRAVETDLLVADGFIEPHFFAGFSGGRKSVLPGVASRATVLANHCSEFIQHPHAHAGSLDDNPIHRDMLFAARAAKLAFIVNVVIDAQKRIVRAFAGDAEAAHAEGCAFLRGCCEVRVPEADIVVTSNGGHPLDQNVYQAVKGMAAAEACCRPGGVIILCAACGDGHGGEAFYRALADAPSPEALLAAVRDVPRDATRPDQWEYQILARIRARHPVILVSADCDHAMLRAMFLEPASTLADALARADALVNNPHASIAVIPDGVSVMVKKEARA